MRTFIAATLVALGLLAAATAEAAQPDQTSGPYQDYPAWAQRALEQPEH